MSSAPNKKILELAGKILAYSCPLNLEDWASKNKNEVKAIKNAKDYALKKLLSLGVRNPILSADDALNEAIRITQLNVEIKSSQR